MFRRDGGQRDEGDGLLAGVGHCDAVRVLRARRQGVDQDLLQQGLGHRAALGLPAVPVEAGHDHLPVRRRAEAGQQHRCGHPQTGGDLGGGSARLDQLQDLLGEAAADRAGGVPAVPLDRDQLGDAVQQVQALLGPVPGVRLDGQQPVGQHGLADVAGGLRGAARRADREQGVGGAAQEDAVGGAAAGAGGGQVLRRQPSARLGRQGRSADLGIGDQPAGGGEDPGPQVQVRAEQVEDHVRAAARRARGHHPAVPVDHRREVAGPLAGDLPHDVLRDGRERHRLVDREEREAVPCAGDDQVLRHVAQLGLAGRQRGHALLHQNPHERLRVRGVPAPGQAREHQLAARQVAAGVAEIGGHHTAHGAVQLVLAAQQLEAQRVRLQQCAQPHARRRRSLSRSRFHRKTRTFLRAFVHTNLQDARPGQPTPSWFP